MGIWDAFRAGLRTTGVPMDPALPLAASHPLLSMQLQHTSPGGAVMAVPGSLSAQRARLSFALLFTPPLVLPSAVTTSAMPFCFLVSNFNCLLSFKSSMTFFYFFPQAALGSFHFSRGWCLKSQVRNLPKQEFRLCSPRCCQTEHEREPGKDLCRVCCYPGRSEGKPESCSCHG